MSRLFSKREKKAREEDRREKRCDEESQEGDENLAQDGDLSLATLCNTRNRL